MVNHCKAVTEISWALLTRCSRSPHTARRSRTAVYGLHRKRLDRSQPALGPVVRYYSVSSLSSASGRRPSSVRRPLIKEKKNVVSHTQVRAVNAHAYYSIDKNTDPRSIWMLVNSRKSYIKSIDNSDFGMRYGAALTVFKVRPYESCSFRIIQVMSCCSGLNSWKWK